MTIFEIRNIFKNKMEILRYYYFSSISLLFLTNYFFLDAKSLSPLHFLTNVSLVADVVVVVQLESGSESESESEAESNSEQESEANLEPDASDPKPFVNFTPLTLTHQTETTWGYSTSLF